MSEDIYVTAAFKCTQDNIAYIFMKNEFVLLDYAQGSVEDVLLFGPSRNDAISSLRDTVFSEKGIDCAFGSHEPGVAYIFSSGYCAKWAYPQHDPATSKGEILQGPMTIATMFPFLKGTVFEHGLDTAFESPLIYEAHLFKGDNYARVYYGPQNPRLFYSLPVSSSWTGFKGTILEKGSWDATLACHRNNQVYVFKGELYTFMRLYPDGPAKHEVRSEIKKIKDYWNGLGSVLPRKG